MGRDCLAPLSVLGIVVVVVVLLAIVISLVFFLTRMTMVLSSLFFSPSLPIPRLSSCSLTSFP